MDRNRLLGGDPLGVALRLIVLSVVVGVVLSAMGIKPSELLDTIWRLPRRLYDLGFGALEGLFGYLVLGALIVVPIWLIVRLVGVMRNRDRV